MVPRDHGCVTRAHRDPRLVGLVLLGGLLGTTARYAVTLGVPTRSGQWPTATFLVNLVGAFALGFLLDRTGDRHRQLRLLIGTGFLGSFTTYSTLAVDTDLLVRDHHSGLAIGYALASLVLGLCATVLGIAAAGRSARSVPVDPDAA